MKIQQSVIIQTFRHVVPIAHEVIERHFDLLIKIYPHFVEIFEGKDLKHIGNQFINTLIFVVDNLEDPAALESYLERLGKKHKNFGVTEEYMQQFRETFIRTMAAFLKEKWTPRAAENWERTFIYVTNFMRKPLGMPPGPEVTVAVKGAEPPQAESSQNQEASEPTETSEDVQQQGASEKPTDTETQPTEASDSGPKKDTVKETSRSDIPRSDTFIPYSKEFFDGVNLDIEASMSLNDEQKSRIGEIAEELAKKLVSRHWEQTFNAALDHQLVDLEGPERGSSDSESDSESQESDHKAA